MLGALGVGKGEALALGHGNGDDVLHALAPVVSEEMALDERVREAQAELDSESLGCGVVLGALGVGKVEALALGHGAADKLPDVEGLLELLSVGVEGCVAEG